MTALRPAAASYMRLQARSTTPWMTRCCSGGLEMGGRQLTQRSGASYLRRQSMACAPLSTSSSSRILGRTQEVRCPSPTALHLVGIRQTLDRRRCSAGTRIMNRASPFTTSATWLAAENTQAKRREQPSEMPDAARLDAEEAEAADQEAPGTDKSRLGQYEPQKLSEDIMTIPNVLTILRLASTPVLGYLIVIGEMRAALGLLFVSGMTDAVDGWLARRYNSATVFGSIADPTADKALMAVMVGALAWRGLLPLPLVALIIGRDVALVISAFLIRWRSLPPPRTFKRYWDPRLPSAKVVPTQVSKYNTLLQIVLVGIATLLASLSEARRQWWAEREGLWEDKAAAAATSTSQSQERGTSSAAIVSDASSDRNGDNAKKAWHSFMLFVSATTLWSGLSYLSGAGSVRVGKTAGGLSKAAALTQRMRSRGAAVLARRTGGASARSSITSTKGKHDV